MEAATDLKDMKHMKDMFYLNAREMAAISYRAGGNISFKSFMSFTRMAPENTHSRAVKAVKARAAICRHPGCSTLTLNHRCEAHR